jgi:ABC-type bacteriocin/lantibiotic exporter with double-glycine peptidase domain
LVNTINMMIFDKSLKFPILSNKQFTEADIINYSQIDADNLTHFATKLMFFSFGVVEIVIGLVLLYIFIGLLFLIPLGVMIIINLISFKIGSATLDYNMKVLEKKDDRVHATEEMLSIIKHIKTNTQ